jgi:hypothetical protein
MMVIGFIVRAGAEDWATVRGISNGTPMAGLDYPRVHAFEHLAYCLLYGGILIFVGAAIISAAKNAKE